MKIVRIFVKGDGEGLWSIQLVRRNGKYIVRLCRGRDGYDYMPSGWEKTVT